MTESPTELKEMLSETLKTPQVQQMLREDPELLENVQEVMKDPEKVAKMTNNPELAKSLQSMLQKDPHAFDAIDASDGPNSFRQDSSVSSVSGSMSIEDMHSKFEELTADDKDHIDRLHKNMELREDLKHKLGSLVDSAVYDNKRIHDRIAAIKSGRAGPPAGGSRSDNDVQALVEGSSSDEGEHIRKALTEFVIDFQGQIEQLHTNDDAELAALWRNAEARKGLKDKLQKRIKQQQAELRNALKAEAGAYSELA